MVGVRSCCTAAASELEDCCMIMQALLFNDTVSESREPVLPEQQSMTLSGSACSGDGNCIEKVSVAAAAIELYRFLRLVV